MALFDRLLQNAGRMGQEYLADERERKQQAEADALRRILLQIELATNPRLRDVTGIPEAPRPSVFEGARMAPGGMAEESAPPIFRGRRLGLGMQMPDLPPLGMGGSRDSAPPTVGLGGIAPVRPQEGGSLLDRWRDVAPRRPRYDVMGRTYEVMPPEEEKPYDPMKDPVLLRRAIIAADPERYGEEPEGPRAPVRGTPEYYEVLRREEEIRGENDPPRLAPRDPNAISPQQERRRAALAQITRMLAAGAPREQVAQVMSRNFSEYAGVWTVDDLVEIERQLGMQPMEEDEF